MTVHMMHARSRLALRVIVLLAIVLSGCRSYGGQGAGEATYRQMEVAHQVFQEELVRAKADLDRLERAATGADVLAVAATQYGQIVRGHEAVLAEHGAMIEDLSEDSGYRSMHRTYGAMIAQQRTIRSQYEGVIANARGSLIQDTTATVERPYSLIPPYYGRVAKEQRDRSVSGLLAEVRSGRVPASGLQIMGPDAGETSSDVEADSSAEAGGAEGPGL